MNFLEKIKEIFCSRRVAFLLLASFLVWGFLMRGFILNKSLLIGDAAAYYEHFKFYLDNISRGVYPMWESSREFGVPSEFFLRRIGSFNPLFYLILLFNVLGLSYLSSYLVFLTVYYFLGMLGFFLLAQRVLKDPITAFAFLSHKLLRWVLPFLLMGMLLTSALLAEQPLYRGAFIAQALFYLWATVGFLARRPMAGIRYALIGYYLLTIHLAYLVGFLRFLGRRQETGWQRVS